MAERATIFQVVQIGVEALDAPGTAVAANKRLQSVSMEPSIQADVNVFRAMGSKFPALTAVGKEYVQASLSGQATYTEIVYLLASVLGEPTITDLGGGAYQWVFTTQTSAADTPQTYTVEQGSVIRAHRFTHGLITGLSMGWSRENIELGGSMIGGKLETDDIRLSTNEIQSVTNDASSGTFTLTFGGQTTATIDYDATASEVQAALEAISTIDAGDIVVTGGPIGTSPVLVEFTGQYAQTDVALMTANDTGLSGGTTTIASETTGATPTSIALVPILPTQVTVYLADAQGDLATAEPTTRIASVNWSIEDRFGPVWELNAAQQSWAAFVETQPALRASVMAQANDTGMGFLTQMRTGATKFLRTEAVGDEIGSSGQNYMLRIDQACKVGDVGNFSDQDGVYAIEFTLLGVHDSTWGKAVEVTVVTSIATL